MTNESVRILAVDVGTGTQDILLFQGGQSIENCFRLVMPSPTVTVAARIRHATADRRPVLLTGRIMGGGPCAWAARDHAQAGLPCYATCDAARTLDDDLTQVARLGLRIVNDADVPALLRREGADLVCVAMGDFNATAIRAAFKAFGVDPVVDIVAVAAFDHGAAPPGVSDRRYRFDAIATRVRERPDPLAFAFRGSAVPADLTRLQAVAAAAAGYVPDANVPVVVMDTGAAALSGALEDPQVRAQHNAVVANIGNFHTLAFRMHNGAITGLFEHHTGELSREQLEAYLRALVAGTLTNEQVFAESGHGALILDERPAGIVEGAVFPLLAVTGPRRELLRGSVLRPYEAVPHGDMMLAGCFGLLRATAAVEPWTAVAIEKSLGPRPR